MHYMHNGMAKGTSQHEVMLNRKKIKHVALAIVKIRLSEASVSQVVSQ